MKRKIKIEFCDWWPGFDKTNNYFYNLLKEEFEVSMALMGTSRIEQINDSYIYQK